MRRLALAASLKVAQNQFHYVGTACRVAAFNSRALNSRALAVTGRLVAQRQRQASPTQTGLRGVSPCPAVLIRTASAGSLVGRPPLHCRARPIVQIAAVLDGRSDVRPISNQMSDASPFINCGPPIQPVAALFGPAELMQTVDCIISVARREAVSKI
jgi:hypothetical protein